MKKRIIAVIVALSMLVTVFSGCGIIVKNQDRNLGQIVAEVGYSKAESTEDKIFVYREKNDAGVYTDSKKLITKRQIVNAFNNVGSQYIQQGYTVEEALEEILKQLTNREIIIQEAIRVMSKENATSKLEAVYPSVEECLTEEELKEAEAKVYDEEYETIKSFFDEIKKENEGDDEEEDEEEEETHEHRTLQNPISTDDEKYEPKYSKEDEKFEGKEAEYWNSAIRRYNKKLNRSETGLNRQKYHDRLVMAEMEQMVIEKYQKHIEDKAVEKLLGENCNYLEEGISDSVKADRAQQYIQDHLIPKYENDLKAQKEKYDNDISGFLTTLDSYAADYSLLYSPVGGYFYVKSLLIAFDGELKEEFTELSSSDLSESAKKAEREKLLKQIEAKDLRDVLKHETNNVTKKEYDAAAEFPSYLPNETGKKAQLKKDSEEDYEAVDDTEKPAVKTLIDNPTAYLAKFKTELTTLAGNSEFVASKYYDKSKTKYENALATLIFKYGTDPGMFNNASDYLVKPFIPGATEKYVIEFAYAARNAYAAFKAANGTTEDKQLASMQIVGNDFGWHIVMVTSEVPDGSKGSGELYSFDINALTAKPIADDTKVTGYEKSFTYSYSKAYQDAAIQEAYTDVSVERFQYYANLEGFVTNNLKVLKDLY